uniref:Uncharacterized protein n=1 Tax=Tanacetum cinerariifolium TaxID=118510 RepID=A0A699GQY1_TANCI|nr:hypothetical protein [Tanacetum cinerariifolium]
MVRSGPGRSSVRSGPTWQNLWVFCKIGPDRTEDRIGLKPRTEDRTEIRSVRSGPVGPVRSGFPILLDSGSGTSFYPCILRDYLSLHDVPLPLLEVHLVLPNRDNTIHERPVGKIGLYTRFFDFANFRLPLSTFLVDILSRHYTLDEDTYPSFVDKNGEDLTKVKVVERERQEDEPRLLEIIVGRTVPLLPVAPDHGKRDLEASVDKLFDEGGSGTQAEEGDSTGGESGLGINIQPVAKTIDTAAEDVVPLQPRRQKRKTVVAVADGLAVGITHSREGRALTDVAGHNPSAEADYVSALQQLQKHLAERFGLNESQPHTVQLMVPIHHSPEKTVVGASALSLALDVFYACVRRIRENIISHGSLFQDVFIPLAEPLTAAALTGMEDDYGVMGMDDQSTVNENVVDEDANPFPNVEMRS